jgi:hypothetical protein
MPCTFWSWPSTTTLAGEGPGVSLAEDVADANAELPFELTELNVELALDLLLFEQPARAATAIAAAAMPTIILCFITVSFANVIGGPQRTSPLGLPHRSAARTVVHANPSPLDASHLPARLDSHLISPHLKVVPTAKIAMG